MKYLTCFESSAWQQNHWTRHMTRFYAHHVWIFVITEVSDFSGLIDPWIPNDCECVEEHVNTNPKWLLHTHLPVSGKLYFCSRIFLPDTTFVIICSCGVCWYIRSKMSFGRKLIVEHLTSPWAWSRPDVTSNTKKNGQPNWPNTYHKIHLLLLRHALLGK